MPLYNFMTGSLPAGMTLTRASVGWSYDATGALVSSAIDAARFDYDPATLALRGLLNEPTLTNGIRNSSMVGAAAGTPGTQPTNWNIAGPGATGLTRTIATGTEDGMPYVEVRYFGTASDTNNKTLVFESNTQIAALVGQPWNLNFTARTVGAAVGTSFSTQLTSRDGAGSTVPGAIASVIPISPTTARLASQTFVNGTVLTGATTAFIRAFLQINYTAGVPLDVTMRVGNPQITPGLVAQSPISTTTVAVTRAADVLTLSGMLNGTYDITVNRVSGATTYSNQVVSSGTWIVPNDPSPVQTVLTTVKTAVVDFTGGTLPGGATLARGSVANYFSVAGVLTSAAINAGRFTYDPVTLVFQGLLNEASDTNVLANSSAIGVVPGTPGTAPTGWGVTSTANGLTRTVVASGVEDGIPYWDVRYAGTPSTSGNIAIRHTSQTGTAALPDSVWSTSVFCRLIAGALSAPINYQVIGSDTGGSALNPQPTFNISPTTAALRTQKFVLNAAVLSNPLVAWVHSRFQIPYTLNVPVDYTIRIGLPQLMLEPAISSPITTTTVVLTRSQEILTIPMSDGTYDISIERLSGTESLTGQVVSGGTGYVVPNSLSPVRTVTFNIVSAVVVPGLTATPVVIVAGGTPVFAGAATPRTMVTSGPVYDGPATPIQIVTGRPVLPGPATPMMVVTGRPVHAGPAIPVL
jgi:hypothetical protein